MRSRATYQILPREKSATSTLNRPRAAYYHPSRHYVRDPPCTQSYRTGGDGPNQAEATERRRLIHEKAILLSYLGHGYGASFWAQERSSSLRSDGLYEG